MLLERNAHSTVRRCAAGIATKTEITSRDRTAYRNMADLWRSVERRHPRADNALVLVNRSFYAKWAYRAVDSFYTRRCKTYNNADVP
jgi:hypothetical protein